MPGTTALIALTLSGAASFATVIGVAHVARHGVVPQAPITPMPAPGPSARPPPPDVHPLDDGQPAAPVPMHEVRFGTLIYVRA